MQVAQCLPWIGSGRTLSPMSSGVSETEDLRAVLLQRLQQEKHALRSEQGALLGEERKISEVRDTVATLHEKIRRPVMVPFGKVAFFPGELVRTNEVLVTQGQHRVEVSTTHAAAMLDRRAANTGTKLDDLRQRLQRVEEQLGEVQGLAANEEGEGMVDIREEWDEQLVGVCASRTGSVQGQHPAAGAAAAVAIEHAQQAAPAAAIAAALPPDSVESGGDEEVEALDGNGDVNRGELPQAEGGWKRRRLGALPRAQADSSDADVAGSDVMFGGEGDEEELDVDMEESEIAPGAHAVGSGGAAEGAGDDGDAEDDDDTFEALMARIEELELLEQQAELDAARGSAQEAHLVGEEKLEHAQHEQQQHEPPGARKLSHPGGSSSSGSSGGGSSFGSKGSSGGLKAGFLLGKTHKQSGGVGKGARRAAGMTQPEAPAGHSVRSAAGSAAARARQSSAAFSGQVVERDPQLAAMAAYAASQPALVAAGNNAAHLPSSAVAAVTASGGEPGSPHRTPRGDPLSAGLDGSGVQQLGGLSSSADSSSNAPGAACFPPEGFMGKAGTTVASSSGHASRQERPRAPQEAYSAWEGGNPAEQPQQRVSRFKQRRHGHI